MARAAVMATNNMPNAPTYLRMCLLHVAEVPAGRQYRPDFRVCQFFQIWQLRPGNAIIALQGRPADDAVLKRVRRTRDDYGEKAEGFGRTDGIGAAHAAQAEGLDARRGEQAHRPARIDAFENRERHD